MDTSETYIKMCEKSKEIQNRRFCFGDYVSESKCRWEANEDNRDTAKKVHFHEIRIIPKTDPFYVSTDSFCSELNIWLPRQDQLQEIVGGYEAGFILWGEWLDNTYPEHKNPFKRIFNSFEQLWLAFVMKENYNKVWNGEDWIEK